MGTRTISLTGRAPVSIEEDDWPQIAEASDDSWAGEPGAKHWQAESQGQVDSYSLRVRAHDDGRAIVYGVLKSGQFGPRAGISRRGGELLEAGQDIAAAIERVGADVEIPEHVIRWCIEDLPAERL